MTDIELRVVTGNILAVETQTIVNAANRRGSIGGGVAGAIRRAAGVMVEQESMHQLPIPIGSTVLTSRGAANFQAIIHGPTMSEPANRTPRKECGPSHSHCLTISR